MTMARPLVRIWSPNSKEVAKKIRLSVGKLGQVAKRRRISLAMMTATSVRRHFGKMEFGGSDNTALGAKPFWSRDRHPLNVIRRADIYGKRFARFPLLGPDSPIERAFSASALMTAESPGLGRSTFTHGGRGHWAQVGAKHQFGMPTTFRYGGKTASFTLPTREFLYWDTRMVDSLTNIVKKEWVHIKRETL